MNHRALVANLTATLACATLSIAYANEGNATAAEATSMVKKAGSFNDRDLYITVYALDDTVRAHGANEKLVGKNLIDLKGVDGKAFVKERKIEPKSMYCEKLEDRVGCGGIYS